MLLGSIGWVTGILACQSLWITGSAFYYGLGPHLVLGTLVQGAALASFYPFIESWAYSFVAGRPALGEAHHHQGPVVKLITDTWSLLRHAGKTLVIWWLWPPSTSGSSFDLATPWLGPYYSWAQTWIIILYYTCICDWFCDYYLYTRSCRLSKMKPKDYNVMIAHHLITIFLMGGSAIYGYFAIGTAVVFLHEWTDVFISLVKIFRTTKSPYLVPLFVTNLGVWFGARLVWFIYGLILPGFTISSNLFTGLLAWSLVALWCMHLYWFCLMVWLAVSLTCRSSGEVTKLYDR